MFAQYWEVCQISDKVSNNNWYERHTMLNRVESPLLEYRMERVDEDENQRITETAEKRQPKNDWLGRKHDEWPCPCFENMSHGWPSSNLIRPVNMREYSPFVLAQPLGFISNQGIDPCFFYKEIVGTLDRETQSKAPSQYQCKV